MGSSLRKLIRLELSIPGGVLAENKLYNSIITAHGLIMIFFFVMPILIGGFGNWLLPSMISSIDMIFPRLKNMRFWLVVPAMLMLTFSFFVEFGAATG